MKRAGKRSRQGELDGDAKKSARREEGGNSFGSALKAVLAQPIPKKSSTPILASARPNHQLLKQREEEKATKEAAKLVVARHKWFEKEHVIPDVADANYEKMLLKLATKGIVKLFNAVQTQQQQRMQEKGNNVVAPKPDKLTKNQFIDLLKGAGKPHDNSNETSESKSSARSRGQDEEEDKDDEADDDESEEIDEVQEDSEIENGNHLAEKREAAMCTEADADHQSESSYFSDGNDTATSD